MMLHVTLLTLSLKCQRNLTIDRKAPGELVGALEVFDAVTSGRDVSLSRLLLYFSILISILHSSAFWRNCSEVTNWYYHGVVSKFMMKSDKSLTLKAYLLGTQVVSLAVGSVKR